jgi:hypothetical protein
MKAIISTKTHGIIDYAGGILISLSPWLFGFVQLGGAPVLIPVTLGVLLLIMALFSDHEFGIFKIIPMSLHLTIDIFAGFILIGTPFIYGFAHLIFVPHVLLGLISLSAGILTRHSPLYRLKLFDDRHR